MSEESAREMAEVERRGLTGGINLVRGIREELRDIEFAIHESNSLKAAYMTKMQMIRSKLSKLEDGRAPEAPKVVDERKLEETHVTENGGDSKIASEDKEQIVGDSSPSKDPRNLSEITYDDEENSLVVDEGVSVPPSEANIETSDSAVEQEKIKKTSTPEEKSDRSEPPENGISHFGKVEGSTSSPERSVDHKVGQDDRPASPPVKLSMNSRFWQYVAPDPDYGKKVMKKLEPLPEAMNLDTEENSDSNGTAESQTMPRPANAISSNVPDAEASVSKPTNAR